MNKLTAGQLLGINRKLTGNNNVASDELMNKLLRISEMPYEQDEKFFYKYKNAVAKASKLGCSIARIKPFETKNNQTAVLALLTLLELNNVKLAGYEKELSALVPYLEAGDLENCCQWIKRYTAEGDMTR